MYCTVLSHQHFTSSKPARQTLQNLQRNDSAGRFESLVPVGAHSKLGKVVKPKTFKTSGAGQPFAFEGAGQSSSGKVSVSGPFWFVSK